MRQPIMLGFIFPGQAREREWTLHWKPRVDRVLDVNSEIRDPYYICLDDIDSI
jgi:hypothetical protein